MSVHPAAAVLADHQPRRVTPATQAAETVRCDGDTWEGPWCEFPAHQAQVLAEAGVLACPSCGHATGEHFGEGCVHGCPCQGLFADGTPVAVTPDDLERLRARLRGTT